MSRIMLVLLIILAVLASPMIALRCQLSAQQGHAFDPCLDEAPAHSPTTHASQSIQMDLLDAIAGNVVISAALRVRLGWDALPPVQGITITPSTPPPRLV